MGLCLEFMNEARGAWLSTISTRRCITGETQEQAGQVITHLAFYVGWPNALPALPVAKDVFEERPR